MNWFFEGPPQTMAVILVTFVATVIVAFMVDGVRTARDRKKHRREAAKRAMRLATMDDPLGLGKEWLLDGEKGR